MAGARKLGELFYEIRGRTEGLKSDVADAERHLGKLTSFVKANPVAAISAVGVALLGVATKAIQMAEQVEKSMRRIAVAIPGGTEGIGKLRKEIAELASETGKSQAELAQAAEQIARGGVEGPEALAQRLRAVETAVSATGASTESVIEGLDQTLDLFGKTSAESAETLGKLFAAAKGRTSLEDLFAGIQAATPAIQNLGLDLDTATRALVALGEQGRSPKQAAAELNKFADAGAAGRERILELAASIPVATDGFQQLSRAATVNNESIDALVGRLKGEFSNVLIDLGTRLLPLVNSVLKSIVETLDIITGKTAAVVKTQGISSLATTLSTAAKASTQGLEARAREFVDAATRLNDIVVKGQGDLVATTADQAIRIRDGAERLVKAGLVSEAQLAPLFNFLDDLAKRSAAAAAPSAAPTGPTADQLKEQQEAAKKADAAIKSLAAQLGNLGSVEEAAAGKTALTVQEHRRFSEEIRKLRDEFPQLASVLDAFQDRLDDLRAATQGFGAASLASELNQLFASMTTTAVDDLTLALQELERELNQKIADAQPEVRAQLKKTAEQILALKKAFIEATQANEDLDRRLERGRQGQITPLQEMRDLMEKQAALQAEIEERTRKGTLTEEKRVDIQGRLAKIAARIAELQEAVAKRTKAAATSTDSLAGKMEKAASVAFGFASALLGADHTLTKMLGSVTQIASGLASVNELADKAGGLAQLFSTSGGILSALPGIGQVVGGGFALASALSGLIGPDEISPAEAERLKATRELTEALENLRTEIGDLLNVDLTGRQLGAIASVSLPAVATGGTGPSRAFAEIQNISAAKDAVAALRKVGISLNDLKKAAEGFGLPLSEIPTLAELRAIQEAIQNADLHAFFNTLAGDLERIDFNAAIRGITDPIELFTERAAVLAKRAPELFGKIFEGLDLSADADRAEALKRLRDQWELFLRDPEAFRELLLASNLTFAEWKEQMELVAKELVDLGPEILTPLERFQRSLAIVNERLANSGLSAAEKLETLFAFFQGQFDEFANLDLGDAGDIQRRRNEFFEKAAEDDVISAEERAILDAFDAIIEGLKGVADEAKRLADEAAEAARRLAEEQERLRAARVTETRTTADRENAFFDRDPSESLTATVRALGELSPAIAGLLDQVDLSSAEGLAEFTRRLQEYHAQIDAGEEITGVGILTLDEFKQILFDLEGAADTATNALQSLAAQLSQAFSDIDLEAQVFGLSFEDALTKKLSAIGLGGFDLTGPAGQEAAKKALQDLFLSTTDADMRRIIGQLVSDLDGLLQEGAAAAAADAIAGGAGATEARGFAQTATIEQFDRFLGISLSQLRQLEQIKAAIEALNALIALPSTPGIQPPAVSPAAFGVTPAAGPVTINIHVEADFSGTTASDPVRAGQQITKEVARQLRALIRQLGLEEGLNAGNNRLN